MSRRIVEWHEMRDMSPEDRARIETVSCGPDCEFCDDTYRRGISIGKLDYMGDPYPEATSVVLDKRTKEWIVFVYDADAPMVQREARRYPADDVEVIRNLPCETRLYSHRVIEFEEDGDEQRVPESHAVNVRELREKFQVK